MRKIIKGAPVVIKAMLLPVLFCGLLYSCGDSAVYEEYVEIPDKGWHKDSSLTFEVEIEDTNAAYQVVWYLRNNNAYPYRNIFLFRKIASERGVEFADTSEFFLADPYGKWLGKGVGELKTNTWPFKKQLIYFNKEGKYTFTLQQAMRTEYLEGVEDVGLGVFKVDTEE